MPRYYLYVEQAARGCDYTIACGVNLLELGSTERERAKEEAIHLVTDQFPYHSEAALAKARLLEVVFTYILPIDSIYKDVKEKELARRQATAEEAERSEYERLKRKFST